MNDCIGALDAAPASPRCADPDGSYSLGAQLQNSARFRRSCSRALSTRRKDSDSICRSRIPELRADGPARGHWQGEAGGRSRTTPAWGRRGGWSARRSSRSSNPDKRRRASAAPRIFKQPDSSEAGRDERRTGEIPRPPRISSARVTHENSRSGARDARCNSARSPQSPPLLVGAIRRRRLRRGVRDSQPMPPAARWQGRCEETSRGQLGESCGRYGGARLRTSCRLAAPGLDAEATIFISVLFTLPFGPISTTRYALGRA